ncbi:MAG TPA: transketolase [Fermentimonas caenicola]|jgi:transketolase|uniref:transketolase n=1 Tax=Fermentimonas caenicola TaxID=1562970 RepID=A0A098BZR1_9BACT|nr:MULTISPECIES: transketolase [Lascolabacillus]MBP6174933.1 transketolase [Fermentimonas sp.]MDI9626930.1 transketolase [Bacteroidota bacterium]TAH61783.1 MAG: transketolase [Fermentimonas caenicola]MBP6196107.1 transketolase [Fermentimonas sp.]MBP7104844.1 transketolase [Fermentimonas sp.]
MNDNALMNRAADNIRILSASMVEKAKSGHPGGAMGGADFINVLFTEFLEYDPENPTWESRDRFFLDPGHMSAMLYSVLCLSGKFSIEELKNFRQWGSPTPGHPERDVLRGIENTSGPLGQGHAFSAGAAIAAKFLKARLGDIMDHTIYSFISDGTIQEEVSQGVGRIAGHLGLDNLIMFYDSNEIQLSTTTDVVTSEDIAKKYEAWNWKVITIDGNDVEQIRNALTEAKDEKEKPTLIIGKTIMGKGALAADNSSFECKVSTHGQPLTAAGADINQTIKNLGGNPDNPFEIFPEAQALYDKRKQELKKIVSAKQAKFEEWAKANPELVEKKRKWFSRELPEIDWQAIQQKPNSATRAGSAAVLSELAQKVENMIVASADLSNSDKTDGFLKKTKSFKKGDFSGAFLQAGVSEFTMSCLSIGMSLHGGVIAACGTFFAFSDYMKPSIRVAALMETPVIFIWTHDAFRVGEDGPTHQPVEQEAQIRLLEKLQNHSGKNSMLVLRPADVHETTIAWKLALENDNSPTGLILSRQNIKDLPAAESRFTEALKAERGAYIVEDDHNYDVILLASGSEVSTLVEGAELLRKDGIKVRIVSVPSEGLFRSQSQEYQDLILPKGKKKFGLTAGLSVTLEGLVGADGTVWGLNSFGFSAPYTVLDEKLGYTGKNVYEQVLKIL